MAKEKKNIRIDVPRKFKDTILKAFASEYTKLFSNFLDFGKDEFLQLLNTNLKTVDISQKDTDFLCELTGNKILHIEFQMSKSNEFIIRNCEYGLRILKKYKKYKIYSLTIYGPGIKPFKPKVRISEQIVQNFIFIEDYKNKFDTKKAIEEIKSGKKFSKNKLFDIVFHCLSIGKCGNYEQLVDVCKLADLAKDKKIRNLLKSFATSFASKLLKDEEFGKFIEEVGIMKTVGIAERIEVALINKGRAEGRVEGRAEGEKEKALRIAQMMLDSEEPIKKIAYFTDLSFDEIEELQLNKS